MNGDVLPPDRLTQDYRRIVLGLLLLTAILLELIVHWYLGVDTVYTHFFYIPVLCAGLWYGVRGIWVAVLLGVLPGTSAYLLGDPVGISIGVRAGVLVCVGFLAGIVSDRMGWSRQGRAPDRSGAYGRALDSIASAFLRFSGLEKVSDLKSRNDVNGLVRLLENPDIDIQYEAAAALGDLRDPHAVGPLMKIMVSDESTGVRWRVAESLVQIGTPAVGPLVGALRHPDDDVRWKAAIALGEIGDLRATGPLIELLKDKDRFVKGRAAFALGRLGEPAVGPLVTALKEGDGSLRWGAAIALGIIRSPAAVTPLIHALADKYENVRAEAAASLGAIGWDAVGPLIEFLKYTEPAARKEVADALVQLGNSDAVEPLIQLLENAADDERAVLIGALEELGGPSVIPLIGSLARKGSRRGRTPAS